MKTESGGICQNIIYWRSCNFGTIHYWVLYIISESGMVEVQCSGSASIKPGPVFSIEKSKEKSNQL